ncbi:MAG: alcohol dehydrogenase, partial [Verrucomicrobia bacterium]
MDGDRIPRFEFATASRIIFGAGTLREAGTLAKEMGSRALVVTGRNADRVQPLLNALSAQKIAHATFPVAGEPTIDLIGEGVSRARSEGCDIIIGFGGGSALDAAKAIAALRTNPGELLDYLEVIGNGKPLTETSAPFMAIPTTAGTGT